MRERGAWEGGTRGGPPLRLRAPPAFSRRRKAAGPLGGGRPFRVRGLLRGLRGSVGGLLHVADPRRAFLAGRGSEGGLRFDALGVRCLSPLLLAQPLPLPCFVWWANLRKGTLRRPWSLFRASEGVVEALLAASPGRSDSNSAYCGCSALA